MIGIGIANSLGVNLSGLSPAAKSFVTAAGISDPTKVKAINDLVIGLQSSGLWSKMKAVYPFVTDNRNLFSYTEDLNNASWNKGGATVIANNAIAPDGSNTAWRITRINSASQGFAIRQDVPIVSSTQYTFSVYLKAPNTSTTIQVDLGDGTATPTVTLTTDWQLYTFVKTLGFSGAFFDFNITSGDGSYCWFWHPQLELGSTATTYQPIATTQQAFISNQFKYNLKDPRDTDAAFRLVFNGGWSFSSTGATPNGVNGYADTKLIPSSVLLQNNSHISHYSRTNSISNKPSIHSFSNTGGVKGEFAIYPYYTGNLAYSAISGDTNANITTSASSLNYFIANRTSSTSDSLFIGTNKFSRIVNSLSPSTSPIFIAAQSFNGAPTAGFFDVRQCAFATIGDGLTDDDATNLYYYTQVFQTTLGRQVGSPAYALPTTYDASAKLYLSAIGSTTDSTLNNAVDTFIKGLKADGIYSKMKAVYPFATDNRNLLSYTDDFNNAFWYKNAVTITTNSVTAPNGTLTADSIVENTVNTDHYVGVASGLTLTAVPYTLSVYLKKAGRDWFSLGLYNGTDSKYAWFNLNTGTIGTINSGVTANIESVGNGWYRCSVTRTMAANSNNFIGIVPTISDGGGAYLGNGSVSTYLWGAQLEIGSTATTYQPILTTQQAYISSQFKYNMVNPQDDDSAFRLVFNGGWTHSANGATPNGVNAYGDTKLLPSSVLSLDSAHVSFYSRTNNNTVGYDIGAANVPSNSAIEIVTRWSNNLAYYSINKTEESIANSDSRGYFIASRTASNSTVLYKNSSVLTSSSLSSQTLPTCNIFISAINLGGTPTASSTKQAAFASIGDGLTDTEAANLYTRVQTFQTALNRQV